MSRGIADDYRRDRDRVNIVTIKAHAREGIYGQRVTVPKSAPDESKWLRAKASKRKPISMVADAVAFERAGWRDKPSWTKPKPSLAALLTSAIESSPQNKAAATREAEAAGPRLIVKHGDESTPVDFTRRQEYESLAEGYSQFNLARHYNIAYAKLSRMPDGKVLLEYGWSGRYEKRTPWRQIRIPRQFSTPRKRR